jgi:hypothetical protein
MSLPVDSVNEEPPTATYLLKLHLYWCSDVPLVGGEVGRPVLGPDLLTDGLDQMFVELSFGGHRQTSPAVHGHAGTFIWNCNFRAIKAVLPKDLDQVGGAEGSNSVFLNLCFPGSRYNYQPV